MKRTLIAILLALFAASAFPAEVSGEKLYGWISSSDSALRLAGTMYIAGVVDDDMLLQAGKIDKVYGSAPGKDVKHFCLPKGTRGPGLVGPVRDVLRDFPATRKQPAVAVIRVVLSGVYPCEAD